MDAVKNRLEGQWGNSRFGGFPTAANMQAAAQGMIEDRPLVTTLLCFGLGLGVGTAIGMVISDCMSEPTTFHRRDPESITQSAIDSLSRMVPDVVARQFRGQS